MCTHILQVRTGGGVSARPSALASSERMAESVTGDIDFNAKTVREDHIR
jgi:hypothetical protein